MASTLHTWVGESVRAVSGGRIPSLPPPLWADASAAMPRGEFRSRYPYVHALYYQAALPLGVNPVVKPCVLDHIIYPMLSTTRCDAEVHRISTTMHLLCMHRTGMGDRAGTPGADFSHQDHVWPLSQPPARYPPAAITVRELVDQVDQCARDQGALLSIHRGALLYVSEF